MEITNKTLTSDVRLNDRTDCQWFGVNRTEPHQINKNKNNINEVNDYDWVLGMIRTDKRIAQDIVFIAKLLTNLTILDQRKGKYKENKTRKSIFGKV